MKYVGEKEIINIFRYLEYLRCDHCNKKININEKYYEVVETNNDGDYDFVFSTPNHCRVTMFIGGNEIFIYKGISSCWSWELTKENYTLACRKAKELFLGEKI